eukprot:gnl/TRDRNA2_/TRDRNA2_69407_c0_seq1.p1 gnl/TRDRNA2_/TRDRNA2_69407_c0~~gnl/TRDRNA2_/TRDRNA2_69407_c0_seq1.p1  ORF type:complete len:391 (-),score=43.45 gnl/TRDRNA2_/TRDRNA2_69407_c0_seq1:242-1414(-)
MSFALADALLQEALPHRARCGSKVLVLLPLLALLGCALLRSQQPQSRTVGEHSHVQEPAVAWQKVQPAKVAQYVWPARPVQTRAWQPVQPVISQPVVGASAATSASDSLATKPVMRAILSSLTSVEDRCALILGVRELNENELDDMLCLIDSVKDNPLCNIRLPFPLPSVSTKLGSLRRLLALVTAGSSDPMQRKRGLKSLLGELCVSNGGIRGLEKKIMSRPDKVAEMAEMVSLAQDSTIKNQTTSSQEGREMKPLMKTLLSSLTSTEERSALMLEVRGLRHVDNAAYESELDSMLCLIDSVKDDPLCKVRLPFPLPSVRTKLGSLRRLLTKVTAGSSDSVQRKRGMLVILAELCLSKGGVRALEKKVTSRPEKVAEMAESVQLWQGPL